MAFRNSSVRLVARIKCCSDSLKANHTMIVEWQSQIACFRFCETDGQHSLTKMYSAANRFAFVLLLSLCLAMIVP